jgi:hypothetical protein
MAKAPLISSIRDYERRLLEDRVDERRNEGHSLQEDEQQGCREQ